MTSKVRRSKYKGVKWIDTRYAKPYIIRMGWKRIQAAMILSQSLSTISIIKSASFAGGAQRISKAMAIAETVVTSVAAVNNIGWHDKAPKRTGEIFVTEDGCLVGAKGNGLTYFEKSKQNHQAGDVQS